MTAAELAVEEPALPEHTCALRGDTLDIVASEGLELAEYFETLSR